MGYTSYSDASYTEFSRSVAHKSSREIFNDEMHQTMSPDGLQHREARDSDIHPESVPIIVALDVTGSMGYIPKQLIKNDLGKLVGTIIKAGIPDPAVCFLAIGDHISDRGPLQVSQFESGDQELVMWLQRTWLEGWGGGSMEESYPLAWLVAAKHTKIDSWEKRKQKGILVTIGDEKPHSVIQAESLKTILGYKQSRDYTAKELLEMAKEQWDVYHIHAGDGSYHFSQVKELWQELLGQQVVEVPNHTNIAETIARMVISTCAATGEEVGEVVITDEGPKPDAGTVEEPEIL